MRGGGVDAYVTNLEKLLRESHELAKIAQKQTKRDYDIQIRERQYKVGDLVYWRRNAGRSPSDWAPGSDSC